MFFRKESGASKYLDKKITNSTSHDKGEGDLGSEEILDEESRDNLESENDIPRVLPARNRLNPIKIKKFRRSSSEPDEEINGEEKVEPAEEPADFVLTEEELAPNPYEKLSIKELKDKKKELEDELKPLEQKKNEIDGQINQVKTTVADPDELKQNTDYLKQEQELSELQNQVSERREQLRAIDGELRSRGFSERAKAAWDDAFSWAKTHASYATEGTGLAASAVALATTYEDEQKKLKADLGNTLYYYTKEFDQLAQAEKKVGGKLKEQIKSAEEFRLVTEWLMTRREVDQTTEKIKLISETVLEGNDDNEFPSAASLHRKVVEIGKKAKKDLTEDDYRIMRQQRTSARLSPVRGAYNSRLTELQDRLKTIEASDGMTAEMVRGAEAFYQAGLTTEGFRYHFFPEKDIASLYTHRAITQNAQTVMRNTRLAMIMGNDVYRQLEQEIQTQAQAQHDQVTAEGSENARQQEEGATDAFNSVYDIFTEFDKELKNPYQGDRQSKTSSRHVQDIRSRRNETLVISEQEYLERRTEHIREQVTEEMRGQVRDGNVESKAVQERINRAVKRRILMEQDRESVWRARKEEELAIDHYQLNYTTLAESRIQDLADLQQEVEELLSIERKKKLDNVDAVNEIDLIFSQNDPFLRRQQQQQNRQQQQQNRQVNQAAGPDQNQVDVEVEDEEEEDGEGLSEEQKRITAINNILYDVSTQVIETPKLINHIDSAFSTDSNFITRALSSDQSKTRYFVRHDSFRPPCFTFDLTQNKANQLEPYFAEHLDDVIWVFYCHNRNQSLNYNNLPNRQITYYPDSGVNYELN